MCVGSHGNQRMIFVSGGRYIAGERSLSIWPFEVDDKTTYIRSKFIRSPQSQSNSSRILYIIFISRWTKHINSIIFLCWISRAAFQFHPSMQYYHISLGNNFITVTILNTALPQQPKIKKNAKHNTINNTTNNGFLSAPDLSILHIIIYLFFIFSHVSSTNSFVVCAVPSVFALLYFSDAKCS